MGLHFWGEKKKSLSNPGIHLKTDFLIEKHKVSALFWAWLSKSLYLYELNTKAILQHKGEVGKNVRPSGRDWIESTMASGMPISWIPMSDGWKSISGTAKRSLASLRICSPVLYFPLKTISSLGWWTERDGPGHAAVQPQSKCVFSPCRSLFWWCWNLEGHNPSSRCFPPPSVWQQTGFSNTVDLSSNHQYELLLESRIEQILNFWLSTKWNNVLKDKQHCSLLNYESLFQSALWLLWCNWSYWAISMSL